MKLFEKRILFVTGKGGVGKTTVSLALGSAAAAAGKRTIVCEVAAQEHASRAFGKARIGFRETRLRDRLYAISIDPDRAMREYLELQLPVKAMSDLLYRSKIFSYLAAATPGLREMVTVGKIWELALPKRKTRQAESYDLVIVDAPATGHGIGLLETPGNFEQIARVGPMANQAGRIHRTITDHSQVGAVIVALPEEMPVNETGLLESKLLDEVGVAVDGVLLNGLYPKRFETEELGRFEEARKGLGAETTAAANALGAALDQANRGVAQTEQLERLRSLVRTEVSTLPFIFEPELGLEAIDQLAAEL